MAFTSTAPAQWGSAGPVAESPTVGQVGKYVQLVNLVGDSQDSELVTAGVFASVLANPATPAAVAAGGPLVGLLEWAAGGGGGSIEFDVPVNVTNGPPGVGQNGLPVIAGGGAFVSAPASSLFRLSVRNDAHFVPNPGVVGAQSLGAGTIVQVSACAGLGVQVGRLTRTVWLCKIAPGAAAGSVFLANVPPFARSFRVLRSLTVPADVVIITQLAPDLVNGFDVFTLAGGVVCPDLALGVSPLILVEFPAANAGVLKEAVIIFDLQHGGN
jgi:hypothetical protein